MGRMRVRTVAVRGGDDCETGPAAEGELGSAHLPTLPSPGERKQPPKTADHGDFDRDARGRHLSRHRARFSRSRVRVMARDNRLAQAIGLTIDPGRNLPDLILVDLGPLTRCSSSSRSSPRTVRSMKLVRPH